MIWINLGVMIADSDTPLPRLMLLARGIPRRRDAWAVQIIAHPRVAIAYHRPAHLDYEAR
jgi:hypothetical protein